MVCFCLLSTFFISFNNVLQCFFTKVLYFYFWIWFLWTLWMRCVFPLKLHFLKGLQWWEEPPASPIQAHVWMGFLLCLGTGPLAMQAWVLKSQLTSWLCHCGNFLSCLTHTGCSSVTLEDLPSGSQVFGDNSEDRSWACPEPCRSGSVLGVSWSVPIPGLESAMAAVFPVIRHILPYKRKGWINLLSQWRIYF